MRRNYFRPVLMSLALAICSMSLCAGRDAEAQTSRAGQCFGTLRVAPAMIHVGDTLRLTGAHFTCTEPSGTLFSTASVFFYRPDLGFHVFTVHVTPRGTYSAAVHIPKRLISVSVINGGKMRRVATRPGRYYLSISLFDVSLAPAKAALATVKLVQ